MSINLAKDESEKVLLLLVEDSPADASLFQNLLSRASDADKFWLIHVKRISKAIKMLKRDRFDAIVLDLSLPDSHGIESIQLVQENFPEIPIVVISDLADPNIIEQSLKMGVQDFINKNDLDPEKISKSLRFSIDRNKAIFRTELITRIMDRNRIPGLPSIPVFMERLKHSIAHAHRRSEKFALALLKFNGLDEISDEFSQFIMWSFARRISESIHEDDLVTCLGKGVFCILFEDIKSSDELSESIRSLQEALRPELKFETELLKIPFNIGISVYPHDAVDADHLLALADLALIQSSQLGGDESCFYSEHLNLQLQEKNELKSLIKGAIENEEFEIYYQARYDAKNLDIKAIQPLLRWKRSFQEIAPAHEFILSVEECHLIEELNRWLFLSVCRKAERWREEGYGLFDLSFNVSKSQLDDIKFPDYVCKVLSKTSLPKNKIYFQISEAHILKYRSRAISWIHKLQSIGCRLIIDDFGKSFSSLTLLNDLRPDLICLASSQTRSLADEKGFQSIDAIIRACHSLNIKVLAKSVEDEDQLNQLKLLGCDFAQGYFLSEVLNEKETEQLFISRPTTNPLYFLT